MMTIAATMNLIIANDAGVGWGIVVLVGQVSHLSLLLN